MSNVLHPIVEGLLLPLLFAVPSGPQPNARLTIEPDPGQVATGEQSVVSRRREVSETVDLIELNHYYDDLGRHSYDQVIFYEWSPDYCRFHVIAWYLLEQNQRRRPVRDSNRHDYFSRWYDRDARLTREVRSALYRETWSQVDPERENKEWLDEKYRVSFLKVGRRHH